MIIAFYPGAGGNRYLKMSQGHHWTEPNISYDKSNPEQMYRYRYLIEQVPQPSAEYTLTHCMNSNKIAEELGDHHTVFIHSNMQQSLRREWILHGHQRFVEKQIKSSVSRLEHYQAFRDAAWPNIQTIEQLNNLPLEILKEVNADYDKINNQTGAVPGILAQLTQQYIDQINSAYEIISWHRDYYQRWPVDFSNAAKVVDIDTSTDEFCVFMRKELSLYQSEVFDSVWDRIYNE